MEQDNKLILFEGKTLRKVWYNEQWYFSIVDVIEIFEAKTIEILI